MLKSKEKWLSAISWEAVIAINQELCQSKENCPYRLAQSAAAVQKQWQAATDSTMTFRELVDFFRRCHDQAPFAFFNGNTFAKILRDIIAKLTPKLPKHEAKMLESSATHYVAGAIKAAEFDQMCSHVDKYFQAS